MPAEHFNRPDYNNWHKYWRHQGESKAQPDDEGEERRAVDFDEVASAGKKPPCVGGMQLLEARAF